MALSREPSRPLTSREIANILGGLAGGLVVHSEPQQVMDAFEHIHEFKHEYLAVWKSMHAAAALKKTAEGS